MKPAVADPPPVTHTSGRLRLQAFWLLIGILGVAWLPPAAGSEPARRPLRVDDLFALEGFGPPERGAAPVAISPDGRAVAFIETRPDNTLARFPIGWNAPAIRGNTDVWLQPASGKTPQNLTHGEADGTGWWQPTWSPDGRHLAMLSTRDAGATLWLWSSERNEPRQLTARNLDMLRTLPRVFVWVDEHHILCSLLAEGEPPDMAGYATEMPRSAAAGWDKKVRGELSASVLESGVPHLAIRQSRAELVLIDVTTGASSVVTAGAVRDFELSPTGKAISFLRATGAYEFAADEILNQNTAGETCALEVVDLQGRSLLSQSAADAVPGSVRWSPDGRQLAFLAYRGRRDQPQKLGRIDLSNGVVQWVDLGDASATTAIGDGFRTPPGVAWTGRGDLVISAAQLGDSSKPGASPRRDWWLIGRDGSRVSFTATMRNAPRQLLRDPARPTAMLGLADGEIWRIDVESRAASSLTDKLAAPVLRWVVPPLEHRAPARLAIETRAQTAGTRDYAVLDLRKKSVTLLPKPEPEAALAAYSPAHDIAIFSARTRNGTHIWRQSWQAARTETLMSTDTFVQQIAMGEFLQIEYRSLDGQPLRGWLLLPPEYQKGKRYPLLTFVYGGLVYGTDPPNEFAAFAAPAFINMQLAAAQGYAVLFPSMPLGRLGTAMDPMLILPNGVLPAIDKAIELGIGDGERVFVVGHSYGGYSTDGLVALTNRFKAAVSLAGATNLISKYGIFDVNRRYTDDAHLPHLEGSWLPAWAESGQGAMGGPPWKETDRYLRNSPLLSVGRIQTPLMMVYGDLDVVAMQQGEELFTGLYRQGKRAELVRYWGEGHNIDTPANVRDLWARMFAWFDEFGDIARDEQGALLWDGERVRSRHGKPPRTPAQFLQLERFFDPQHAVATAH